MNHQLDITQSALGEMQEIELEDICSICLEYFPRDQELTLLLSCGHFFHTICLESWIKTVMKCPLCRTQLSRDALVNTSADQAKEYRVRWQDDQRRSTRRTEIQIMSTDEALQFFDYANRRVFRNVLKRPDTIIFCNRTKSSNIIHILRENPGQSTLKYQVPKMALVIDKKRKIFELMRQHYDIYFREHDVYRSGIDKLCEIFLRPTSNM